MHPRTAPELTLLITTIDEAENLKVLVPRLHDAFKNVHHEILILDGHSRDNTREVAKELGCRVEVQQGPNYASAIREGLAKATGEYLIVMDADLSHTPEDAYRLFSYRNRADIVINSRFMPGGGSEGSWDRVMLSRILNKVYAMVLGLPFHEISGGFRVYRREILATFQTEAQSYDIQEELLAVPFWQGRTAIEIPYIYRARVKGVSKTSILKVGRHLIRGLARMRKIKKVIRSTPTTESATLHRNVE